MTKMLSMLALGAMPTVGSATVSMARGGGRAASGHGFSTGRRSGDYFCTDPYFCEPYPSNGSKYLGTDGIFPYCP